jgi:hypothetical protein
MVNSIILHNGCLLHEPCNARRACVGRLQQPRIHAFVLHVSPSFDVLDSFSRAYFSFLYSQLYPMLVLLLLFPRRRACRPHRITHPLGDQHGMASSLPATPSGASTSTPAISQGHFKVSKAGNVGRAFRPRHRRVQLWLCSAKGS